jgi:hypothetical protein
MVCTRQYTGPAERIGAAILRLDGRLRVAISVDSAQSIVPGDAGHHDVTFHHGRSPTGRHSWVVSNMAGPHAVP